MDIIKNNKSIALPDAIIVGAAKAGTTSLFNYLTDHPQVFSPRIKEPWFFSFKDNPQSFIVPHSGEKNSQEIIYDEKKYFDLYSNTSKYIIDGSTSYLYTSETTIKNIKDTYGEKFNKIKIVIVLRNPVQRAWSHYMMHVRDNKTKISFGESITKNTIQSRLVMNGTIGYDYIGFGMYYKQVKLFMETFSNIKIILYDDFVNDQLNVLDQLVDFFGLDRYNFETKQKYNVSGAPKNRFYKVLSELINKESSLKSLFKKYMPKNIIIHLTHKVKKELYKKVILTQKEKEILLNIYKDDIVALQSIINNDLKHWLK